MNQKKPKITIFAAKRTYLAIGLVHDVLGRWALFWQITILPFIDDRLRTKLNYSEKRKDSFTIKYQGVLWCIFTSEVRNRSMTQSSKIPAKVKLRYNQDVFDILRFNSLSLFWCFFRPCFSIFNSWEETDINIQLFNNNKLPGVLCSGPLSKREGSTSW